jgi:hypothetical protein
MKCTKLYLSGISFFVRRCVTHCGQYTFDGCREGWYLVVNFETVGIKFEEMEGYS